MVELAWERAMAWVNLGYHRGWTLYWESQDGRRYAKEGGLLGATRHFEGRIRDRATAWADFKAWADRP